METNTSENKIIRKIRKCVIDQNKGSVFVFAPFLKRLVKALCVDRILIIFNTFSDRDGYKLM